MLRILLLLSLSLAPLAAVAADCPGNPAALGTGRVLTVGADTHRRTAAMLPELLREMRRQDYRVVHVIAAGTHTASPVH